MRTLRLGRPGDGGFDAVLRLAAPDHARRFADARRVGRFHGWPGMPGFVRRPWGPGWALIGDAGYFKDPISTHGLTDALRDAELLAGALVEALAGGDERSALAAYQHQRDRLSRDLFRVSDEIASYDWDGRGVQPLLRRLSAAMADEVELLAGLGSAARPGLVSGAVG
jgi:flavin-dependent dehydrogenase